MKRVLGICVAALLILPACEPKQKEVDVPAEIARNLAEGDSNLRNNKTAEAKTNYEVVLGYDANNAAALTGLGRIALDAGDPAGAIEPLAKAVAADPQYALGHASLGRAYAGTKDWAKAAEHLGKAWELEQDTEQYGLEYGVALREAKQLDKAAEVLKEVAEINPKLKYVYRELGKVQYDAGELDKSLRTFMKAQTQWAGDQDAFAGAAMVYEAQGEIGKSIDQWSQYIQQDCCSTYSKEVAQPKLAELKEKENAAPND
ncbi:MAG: tetratricopeptide repeat protein [Enhygromyxa sp.]